jgi:CO dehydrogenase/acetyl-CoA synthase alpha subunit
VRIVWEAKQDKSYDLKRALAELDTARKNRQAQIGVFVFSRITAPDGLSSFSRYGNDIVVVWDESDITNDVFVHAAYSVARALAIRQKVVSAKTDATTQEIELAVRAVEKHIRQLEDIETWAGTIESNSKKLLERTKRMREALTDEIERLDESLVAFKSDVEPTE